MIARALEEIQRQYQQELMETFQLFDTRGKGYIDSSALVEGMKSLGYQIDKKQISQMIDFLEGADQDQKKGVITRDAFKRFMTARLDPRDPEQQLKSAYEFFDQNGRGKISLTDLQRVAQEFGQSIEQCEIIMRQGDKDQDGFLSYQQFMRIVKKTSY